MMALFDGFDPFECSPADDGPSLLAAVGSLLAGAFVLAALVAVAVYVVRMVI